MERKRRYKDKVDYLYERYKSNFIIGAIVALIIWVLEVLGVVEL